MLGVIGGMGPLATADFFRKLIDATPAERDEDHIPVLIHSVPQVPSRPAAILHAGPSPLPALLIARDRLLAAGATLLAMPCNTAHYWYNELIDGCPVPFIHIVDAVADRMPTAVREAAIIATRATLHSRVFEQRLATRGISLRAVNGTTYDRAVQPAIDAVKRGATRDGGRLLEPVIAAELERGAGTVILACTELPVALDAVESPLRNQCIDSTDALARACVKHFLK